MDTLDDFAVMNIIAQCDMRTVFGALPLVCRRMYTLYDDVIVVRRFRDELRARITAPRDRREQTCTDIILCRYEIRRNNGHIWHGKPVRLPLDLVAKADLGAYLLNITINITAADHSETRNRRVFTHATQSMFTYLTYGYIADCSISCKLTTTFDTICSMLDKCVIANMLAPAIRIMYHLRACGSCEWLLRDRTTCSDQTLYELGFGCEYNMMDIMILIDVNLYEIIDEEID